MEENNINKDMFREEAYELLSELESSLMELEGNPRELDLVCRVFRAMHTMKGSGAMYGLDDISSFTHEAETVFDSVRDGDLAVTKELIDLTLLACDHIRLMLGSPDCKDTDLSGPSGRTAIIASFRGFMPVPPERPKRPIASESVTANGERENPAGRQAAYLIRFRPGRDIFRSGTDPLNLLDDLRRLGSCSLHAKLDAIPAIDEMDPEGCYTGWEITLSTDRGINEIKDVFIFVSDDSELSIEALTKEVINKTAQSVIPASEARGESSVRIPLPKLDKMVDLVGELVTAQARLSRTALGSDDPELLAVAETIERLTDELREGAMGLRTVPVAALFGKFRRLVRDLSSELGKDAALTTYGGETELDKNIIEKLSDPLLHLIRNALDHGIERPEARAAAGKPEKGTVSLSAAHSGHFVTITVRDDGRGLDPEAIRLRAIEKGLIGADENPPERELYNFIFMSGFSTTGSVTDISGRGVGMDVVRRSVEALQGSVELESRMGEGTAVTLKIPLTLAIIDGLLVRVAAENFVIPLSSVIECVELTNEDVLRAHGRNIANVRGEIVPYVDIAEEFMIGGTQPEIRQVVVTNVGGGVGFVVDNVIGEHQTVIKNLGRFYKGVRGISGATILGDGMVALILDIPVLVKAAEAEALREGKGN